MPTQAEGAFEESMMIQAAPFEVFEFVADVSNLPKYIPTTQQAQTQGPDRVRVQGEVHGHQYDSDGFLRADRQAMRLEWGADEGYYAGNLQIQPDGDGCFVTVTIELRRKLSEEGGPTPDQVHEGLRKGLESIKNHVEGHGGKEEPAVAT